MSYTIDVYRRKCPVQHNIISFGCYVAMFPQLIAGPIVRYVTIAQELNERRITREGFVQGLTQFMLGLAKKVLLANNIGALWELIKAQGIASIPALTAWLGILAFAFQIYFDFAGYSQMAIGLGRIFGFSFPDNFNHPYIATSVTDFWRRWHITLSTWFREYLYIPLGGNRCSRPRQIRNLIIVWAATGIWHGASWNFLAWGMFFGIMLILEKYVYGRILERLPRFFGWLYTMLVVLVGWCFFAFDALSDGALYLTRLLGVSGGLDSTSVYLLSSYGILFIILALCSTPLPSLLCQRVRNRFPKAWPWLSLVACLVGFFLCVAYIVDSSYNPFLYFRF
jgi:alginate O-acetyltransferase complex protein AlgI